MPLSTIFLSDFESVPIVWYWLNPTFTEYNKLIISDHQFPVKFRFKMALLIVISINLFLKYSKLLMTPPLFYIYEELGVEHYFHFLPLNI